jgi:hypothetical protein
MIIEPGDAQVTVYGAIAGRKQCWFVINDRSPKGD